MVSSRRENKDRLVSKEVKQMLAWASYDTDFGITNVRAPFSMSGRTTEPDESSGLEGRGPEGVSGCSMRIHYLDTESALTT